MFVSKQDVQKQDQAIRFPGSCHWILLTVTLLSAFSLRDPTRSHPMGKFYLEAKESSSNDLGGMNRSVGIYFLNLINFQM